MKNKIIKIKAIPLSETMENYSDAKQEIAKAPVPGVTFNDSVYTMYGDHYDTDNVFYSTMLDVNNRAMEWVIDSMNNNTENAMIKFGIVNDLGTNNFVIAENVFLEAIYSCTISHINALNNLFVGKDGNNVFSFDTSFVKNKMMFISVGSIYDIVSGKKDSAVRNSFETNILYDSMLSSINNYATGVYHSIRMQLNDFISVSKIGDIEALNYVVSNIDSEFAKMMMDFIYEISVYCTNAEAIYNSIPDTKYMVESYKKITSSDYIDNDNIIN